jgi:hypothetical protein
MKFFLNDYEKISCFFFSVFCSDLDYNCFAQTKVSGVVVDKQNQPIPFVNVVFKDLVKE